MTAGIEASLEISAAEKARKLDGMRGFVALLEKPVPPPAPVSWSDDPGLAWGRA